VPPSPVAPEYPMLDPGISLSFIAANTTTIRLGTGIIILPQRNPVVLAKELASLDVLSNGRLIFGIGIGYLKPEFDAIGAPFDHKGPRTEEYLKAMLALWTMAKPEFNGQWVKFKGVNTMPRPVQKPHPEIVFGGHTKEAYSRAARLAKGWYGFAQDLDSTQKCLSGLREACKAEGKKYEDIEISITPRIKVDRDTAKRFADLGVHRLILLPRAEQEAAILAMVSETARDLIGKV
jgi:probable F420-dependent oxidoreductase